MIHKVDSSPSPLPQRYLAPRGYVQDYIEEDDYFEEQPHQQTLHSISTPYPHSEQIFACPDSQHDSHHSYQVHQESNPNYQSLDAYIDSSPCQNNYQAYSTLSRPARSEPFYPGSNPRNSHGIPLKHVSILPDIYRSFFKFGVFNAIQSRCYDSIMNTHDNMVVSAPTGSGKTVLFELALINLLMEQNSHNKKCVYMAPTKALCSERHRDWTVKLDPIGIKCCELTGDTIGFGRNAWGDAKNSSVIITTPEKFDSLSRNWRDHCDILSQTQLFLIDEVHILNETRGSTLEVVASRMKAKGISVRFLLVSATVPNIDDIAAWIGNGNSNGPATVFSFGDEFRPCKLTRVVYGYPRKGQNDFSFSHTLDYKILSLLQKHSANKPVLVFCATRKGVVGTAQVLMKEYQTLMNAKKSVPWAQPRRIDAIFQDSQLRELAAVGIGVHHAGLTLDDRRVTEDLFLKKIIHVVVSTSTLAVGVNLPAHTVVVKGVKIWTNGTWQEYSDLDFIQMIGRAGRPQFDTEGVALILCDSDLERKYKELVGGKTLLESCLHLNLSEHLNSEIGLGTITNLHSAKEWLHSSFLFQRIQKNPRHYALDKAPDQTWRDRLDGLVELSIADLQNNELVTRDGRGDSFGSTEYGHIMSKYYIRLSTMVQVLKIPETPTLRDILEMIASAEEIDLRLRAGEKQIYKKIAEHSDIRFRTKIDKSSDKVFILIQAVLGGVSLSSPEYKTSDSQPYLEALTVFKHAPRIARTIAEVAIVKRSGAMLKHGMELVRSLSAKAWEDRPVMLRQIEHIGEKSIKVLAEHGIPNFAALRREKPARIEILLNRRPPFGNAVLAAVSELPQFNLKITEASISTFRGEKPILVELDIECGLDVVSSKTAAVGKVKKNKTSSLGMTGVLTLTSDNDFVDFRRIPTKALRQPKSFTVSVQLTKPSQAIITHISPDNFAGLTVTETYRPSVEPQEYPTRNTRPASYDVDAVLAGLEEDPTFWEDDLSRDGIEHASSVPSTPKPKNKDKPKATSASKCDSRSKGSLHPAKLSNGNYECLHACKDKTKCRHLCCRDGVAKPPKKSSHFAALGTSQGSASERKSTDKTLKDNVVHAIQSEGATKGKGKIKRLTAPEKELNHLKILHQSTGGLELPDGRRLTLESGRPVAARTGDKKGWNMDLTFTDLEQTTNVDAITTGCEDLPDPQDVLFQPPKSHQSTGIEETNGDDSDQNTSFSNLPLILPDDDDDDGHFSGELNRCVSVFNESLKTAKDTTGMKSPKHKRPSLSPAPVSKRRRLQASQTGSSIGIHGKESEMTRFSRLEESGCSTVPEAQTLSQLDRTKMSPQNRSPLFLEGAFSDGTREADEDGEPFAFDPSTFDMEATPFSPGKASLSLTQKSLAEERRNNTTLAHTGSLEDCSEDNGEQDGYAAREWATFEEWLHSGAVEITDTVT